jgi:hypothetical protein
MIVLPPACDRAAASALFPDFAEGIGAAALEVDASRVERVGLAMLQLLVSAARSEGGISVHQPTDAFLAALRLTGLEPVVMEGAQP